MAHVHIPRPNADEYNEFYAGYVAHVPEADALPVLRTQLTSVRALLETLSESDAAVRYAPGKWSIKQVLGHLADAERIFAGRALRFARADETPLPAFDETAYVRAARFDDRTLHSLLDELHAVRAASLALFESLDAQELERRGVASTRPITVRALAYIIPGHMRHHETILRERYMPLVLGARVAH